jgi:pimeloyl-ACP methyl ester carboxylesterase
MPYAQACDGAQLWFDVAGTEGPPVLLIAGNACDHRTWDDVVPALAQHHRVVRYDHRGTGQSDACVPPAWSTRDFARDAAAVLDAAGFARAHVYGHSMGGRVAQWFGVDFQPRTTTLVLGATAPGGVHGVSRPAHATAAMTGNDAAALARMCYPDGWVERHLDAVRAAAPNPRTPEAFAAHMAASTSHDAWAVLPDITAPTLVIHGAEDTLTLPANGKLLAERIRGAHLCVIDGARHVYWAGRPEVNDTVLGFFRARG